jgi:transcriptional regulator with XRE-family HTH domain
VSPTERKLRAGLARNVRRLRGDASLTLEAAAHAVGIHTRHLQKIESGEVNVTLRTLARIADVLKLSAASLLE